MKEENLKKDFVDKKGDEFTVEVISDEGFKVLENKPYKLQIPEEYNYKEIKRKGIFTSDIGIKSSGFAPIFTLALIISIGGIIIAYLLWRF